MAESKARVTGHLEGVYFRDGQDIAVGKPLFDLDRRTYKAGYDRAAATLEKAAQHHATAKQNTAASRLGRGLALLLLPPSLLGRGFDSLFRLTGRGYGRVVGAALRVPALALVADKAIVAGFQSMPTGFIPQQDKGDLVAVRRVTEWWSRGRG